MTKPSTSSKRYDAEARGDAGALLSNADAIAYKSPPDYSARCTLSPVFRSPKKNVHSDMYDTAFALHSLGGADARGTNGYLSRVRGLWDDHIGQSVSGCNINANNSCDDPLTLDLGQLDSDAAVDLESIDENPTTPTFTRSPFKSKWSHPPIARTPRSPPTPDAAAAVASSSGSRKPYSWRLMCEMATRSRRESAQHRRVSDIGMRRVLEAKESKDKMTSAAPAVVESNKKKRASFGGEKLKKSIASKFSRRSQGFELFPEVNKNLTSYVEAVAKRKDVEVQEKKKEGKDKRREGKEKKKEGKEKKREGKEKGKSGGGVAKSGRTSKSPRRKSKSSRKSYEGKVTFGDVDIPAGCHHI